MKVAFAMLATAVLALSATSSQSAPVSYFISFEASDFETGLGSNPAPFDTMSGSLTLTYDPAISAFGSTSIVLHSLTLGGAPFVLGSQVAYSYASFSGQMWIGGLDTTVTALTNLHSDFVLYLEDMDLPAPVFRQVAYVHPSVSGSWFTQTGTMQVSETPLPAALPLFATGLGALAWVGWKRKRFVR